LFRNSSVCFGCFDKGSKHRNKPKIFLAGFTKQTETNAKQILFRFVSVRTENYFFSFRGHPICVYIYNLKQLRKDFSVTGLSQKTKKSWCENKLYYIHYTVYLKKLMISVLKAYRRSSRKNTLQDQPFLYSAVSALYCKSIMNDQYFIKKKLFLPF
jgi:hypothetical protein